MENKSNESTPNRPEGGRTLDAPLVEMDLQRFIEQIQQEPAWKESDRNSITVFKSDQMRIVLIGLHEGTELKTHTANGTISVQLLQGHIEFTAAGRKVTLQEQKMIALHPQIPHSVFAVKESFFLLTLAML